MLVAYLNGRRALLVLDNFEHVLGAAPLRLGALGGRAGCDVPDHEPRAARHLGGAGVPRPRAPGARRCSSGRDRAAPADRGDPALRRPRTPRAADFELSESNADRLLSSASVWTACRSRSSSRRHGSSCSRRPRFSSALLGGSASEGSGRRRCPGATPDVASRDRVELRPADGGGAGALHEPRRLRRRLHARSCRCCRRERRARCR